MMGVRKNLKLIYSVFNPLKETRLPKPKLVRRIQNTPIDLNKIVLEGVYVLHISNSRTSENWLKVGKTYKNGLTKRLKQIEREFNSVNGYTVTPLYWSIHYGLFWERHTCYLFEQRTQQLYRAKGLSNDDQFGMYKKELFKLTTEQNKDKTSLISETRNFHSKIWNDPRAKTVGHFGRLA
tara:strand:+ start:73 stop:612 length:540 start_codon:yes stop_codon:yes gene_type:complete